MERRTASARSPSPDDPALRRGPDLMLPNPLCSSRWREAAMPFNRLSRREFITLLGGAATAWSGVVRAQQGERVRGVGVVLHVAESDPGGQARLAEFVEGLKELGCAEGHNLRFDIRWGPNNPDRYPRQAAELVAMAPDVLVAPTSFTLAPLQRATRSIPIVFVGVIDPVGAGF